MYLKSPPFHILICAPKLSGFELWYPSELICFLFFRHFSSCIFYRSLYFFSFQLFYEISSIDSGFRVRLIGVNSAQFSNLNTFLSSGMLVNHTHQHRTRWGFGKVAEAKEWAGEPEVLMCGWESCEDLAGVGVKGRRTEARKQLLRPEVMTVGPGVTRILWATTYETCYRKGESEFEICKWENSQY